ncbi:MAG TPA: hypothetical protein VJT31_37000 [Rugosimonospora sp.]|nr:hypothetical protein [Rugosimonospora sp.]
MDTLRALRVADQLPEGTAARGGPLALALLRGTWYATNPDAGGVVRLDLSGDDGALRVRAFGAGEPESLDWGEIPATAYGAGVVSSEAMAFSAQYQFDFVTVLLAAYAKQGILVLDTFNTFTDGSGRANYFSREFFHR